MSEFDDKLNSLLSDPAAMDQIMHMARSLMGGASAETPGTPPPNSGNWQPSQDGGTGQSQDSRSPGYGAVPPQEPPSGWGAGPAAQNGSPSGTGTGTFSGGGPDWSALSGLSGIDPQSIARLLPILRELNGPQDSNARQLLFALRPYLKPERQEKVERALQLARLFRVGKKFLLKGDLHV